MDFTRQFCLPSKLQKGKINRKITQAELKANASVNPQENPATCYDYLIKCSDQLPVLKPKSFIYKVANSKNWLELLSFHMKHNNFFAQNGSI